MLHQKYSDILFRLIWGAEWTFKMNLAFASFSLTSLTPIMKLVKTNKIRCIIGKALLWKERRNFWISYLTCDVWKYEIWRGFNVKSRAQLFRWHGRDMTCWKVKSWWRPKGKKDKNQGGQSCGGASNAGPQQGTWHFNVPDHFSNVSFWIKGFVCSLFFNGESR